MKTIVIYGRRTPCWMSLFYLVSKKYNVRVISDDEMVLWVAKRLGIEIVSFEEMGMCHLFLCIHGTRILKREEFTRQQSVNIHPTLELYRGKDPIRRYIENKNTNGSVSSHYMIEEVDAGLIIDTQYFDTPICKTHADFYNVAYIHYIKCLDETLNKLGI